MNRAILWVSFVALSLVACSGGPLREDVISQARPGGRIAFDVVKIDDAVLTTLHARPQPAFRERFAENHPPPDLKIAVGDTVSVVIWESAADGLFGTSLTELSFPAGASAARLTGQSRISPEASGQAQDLTASPDTLARLFGATAAQGGAPPAAGAALGGAAALGAAATLNGGSLAEQTGTASGSPSTPRSSESSTGTPGLGVGTATGLADGTAPGLAAGTTPGSRQIGRGANLSAQGVETLLNLAVQSGRPGTRIPDQQVGSDGAISIPYAGRIAVAGRTPIEVQHTIERLLGPKALDPQAIVIVKRSAANSVSVSGEVIGGARVELSPGGNRLLQVIAAAGGAKAPVHDTFVQLSRAGATATVPLAILVADPGQDIFAEPGDVLTLVQRPQTFSVFGATGKNTAITFTSDRLSLSEAMAKAGGLLDERADPSAVFLFRYEPVSVVKALGQPIATDARDGLSPIAYRLDLREAKSYLLAREFGVHDKDVIFVANAETIPIYDFFQVLSTLTGPITSTLSTCLYFKTC
jgi:polysaccharide export outer membrane protein